MNDATRAFVEEMKAKRKAREDEQAAKQLRIKEAKQRRREETMIRIRRENKSNSADDQQTETRPKLTKDTTHLTPDQIAQIGSAIAGSSLVRDFCCRCGEAMRVVDASKGNVCLDCKPTGQPGTRTYPSSASEIAYHGGRFNAGEW